jgi:hypothetical protein
MFAIRCIMTKNVYQPPSTDRKPQHPAGEDVDGHRRIMPRVLRE